MGIKLQVYQTMDLKNTLASMTRNEVLLRKAGIFLCVVLFSVTAVHFTRTAINNFYAFYIAPATIVPGKVLKCVVSNGEGGPAYFCTISYPADGRIYQLEELISHTKEYGALNAGSDVKVTYSDSDPLHATANVQFVWSFAFFAAAGLMLALVYTFISFIRELRIHLKH